MARKSRQEARKDVVTVAIHTTDQYDKARAAAAAGVATKEQLNAVAREARQAGPRGSAAREALK